MQVNHLISSPNNWESYIFYKNVYFWQNIDMADDINKIFSETSLINDLRNSLKSYAFLLTKNEDDANDLVQQVFEKALLKKEQFKSGSVKAWMTTIMKTTFIDNIRKKKEDLPGDELQEVSIEGDQLSAIGTDGDILGSYDVYNKNYVISLQPNGRYSSSNTTTDLYKTLTWDELNAGWVSFYTYQPDIMFSVRGDFYSASPSYNPTSGAISTDSYLWKHYTNADRNSFYNYKTPSSAQFVFNPEPNFIKTFKTVNYEGSNGWEISDFKSDSTGQNASVTPTGNWLSNFDQATGNVRLSTGAASGTSYNKIYSYNEGLYTENNIEYRAGFYRKQNKYYAVVPNNTQTPMYGEVIFGNQTMGIKGYFTTVTMKTDNTTNNGGPKSLFAVSSEFITK